MRKILKVIDTLNESVGRTTQWLAIIVILVLVAEVFMRYVLNRPTTQGPIIATWAGTAMYALSWGYIHLRHRHVRVDVLYARLSARGKAVIDVVCALLFLFPLLILMTIASWKWTWYAWATGEHSLQTYWYPITGPIRTIIFLAIVAFTLQGLAQLFRDFYLVLRNKAYD